MLDQQTFDTFEPEMAARGWEKGGDRFFRSGKIPPVGTAAVVSLNPINQQDVGTAFPPPYLWDEIRITLGHECRLFNIAHFGTIF